MSLPGYLQGVHLNYLAWSQDTSRMCGCTTMNILPQHRLVLRTTDVHLSNNGAHYPIRKRATFTDYEEYAAYLLLGQRDKILLPRWGKRLIPPWLKRGALRR